MVRLNRQNRSEKATKNLFAVNARSRDEPEGEDEGPAGQGLPPGSPRGKGRERRREAPKPKADPAEQRWKMLAVMTMLGAHRALLGLGKGLLEHKKGVLQQGRERSAVYRDYTYHPEWVRYVARRREELHATKVIRHALKVYFRVFAFPRKILAIYEQIMYVKARISRCCRVRAGALLCCLRQLNLYEAASSPIAAPPARELVVTREHMYFVTLPGTDLHGEPTQPAVAAAPRATSPDLFSSKNMDALARCGVPVHYPPEQRVLFPFKLEAIKEKRREIRAAHSEAIALYWDAERCALLTKKKRAYRLGVGTAPAAADLMRYRPVKGVSPRLKFEWAGRGSSRARWKQPSPAAAAAAAAHPLENTYSSFRSAVSVGTSISGSVAYESVGGGRSMRDVTLASLYEGQKHSDMALPWCPLLLREDEKADVHRRALAKQHAVVADMQAALALRYQRTAKALHPIYLQNMFQREWAALVRETQRQELEFVRGMEYLGLFDAAGWLAYCLPPKIDTCPRHPPMLRNAFQDQLQLRSLAEYSPVYVTLRKRRAGDAKASSPRGPRRRSSASSRHASPRKLDAASPTRRGSVTRKRWRKAAKDTRGGVQSEAPESPVPALSPAAGDEPEAAAGSP